MRTTSTAWMKSSRRHVQERELLLGVNPELGVVRLLGHDDNPDEPSQPDGNLRCVEYHLHVDVVDAQEQPGSADARQGRAPVPLPALCLRGYGHLAKRVCDNG